MMGCTEMFDRARGTCDFIRERRRWANRESGHRVIGSSVHRIIGGSEKNLLLMR
jgi:hypothetical protein